MRRILMIAAALAVAQTSHAARPSAEKPMARFDGGTAFMVDGANGQWLLHCIHGGSGVTGYQMTEQLHASRRAKVQMDPSLPDWSQPGKRNAFSDGVTVWKVTGNKSSFHAFQLAKASPRVGEVVTIHGYPEGGPYETISSRVQQHRPVELSLEPNARFRPGYSGGPVLNEAGEVVGMAVGFTDSRLRMSDGSSVPRRYWKISCVSLETLKAGVAIAEGAAPPPELLEPKAADELPRSVPRERVQGQRQVVGFVTDNCSGCDFFKRDVAQGHFSQFSMILVHFNRSARTWSDGGAAFEEFCKSTGQSGRGLEFPVIWVRGTDQYKDGYLPQKRGGLIGFLGGILDGIARVVVGEGRPAEFPKPYVRNQAGDAPEPSTDPAPMPLAPLPDVGLTASVAELKGDIEAIKNGSLFEKIGAFRSIREDLANVKTDAKQALVAAESADSGNAARLKEQAAKLQADIEKVRSGNPFLKVQGALALKKDVKESMDVVHQTVADVKGLDPVALIGLIGMVRAFIRRRKEDQEADELAELTGGA